MKINKLAKELLGSNFSIEHNNRCTGKTTADALAYIASVMHNPGLEVEVGYGLAYAEKKALADTVLYIIEKLGLKHIKFKYHNTSIVYELYEEVEEPADNKNTVEQLYKQLSKAVEEHDLDAVETYSKAIQRLN